jgi:hypothetical protein
MGQSLTNSASVRFGASHTGTLWPCFWPAAAPITRPLNTLMKGRSRRSRKSRETSAIAKIFWGFSFPDDSPRGLLRVRRRT